MQVTRNALICGSIAVLVLAACGPARIAPSPAPAISDGSDLLPGTRRSSSPRAAVPVTPSAPRILTPTAAGSSTAAARPDITGTQLEAPEESVPAEQPYSPDLQSLPGFASAVAYYLQQMDFNALQLLFSDPVYLQVCGGDQCSTQLAETARLTARGYVERQVRWLLGDESPEGLLFEVGQGDVAVFALPPRWALHTFHAFLPNSTWHLYFGIREVGESFQVTDVFIVFPPP